MPQELIARIRALLRRSIISLPPVLSRGNLSLNPATCEISYKKSVLPLTPKEYALLELFLRNPCRVFNYNSIIEHLWPIEEPATDNTVRAHIKTLRNKLKATGASPELIENIYGLGYRIQKPSPTPTIKPLPNAELLIKQTVGEIWDKVQKKTLDKVMSIQDITNGNKYNSKIHEHRQEAYQEAHKLAGSLGTYGYTHGSEIAKKIELLLVGEVPLTSEKNQEVKQLTIQLYEELSHPPKQPIFEMVAVNQNQNLQSLLIVDDDVILGKQIVKEAHSRDIDARIAPSVGVARAMMEESKPNLILLDLNFSRAEEDGLMLLEDIAYHHPEIPVVIFSVRSSFLDRLTVCRLGSRAFLQKPMSIHQILDIVTEVISNNTTKGKIMAIDDDPQILTLLKTLLSPFGLEVTGLSTPGKFWEILEISNPDLLILDVEMPHYNGIDLCHVIRNEPRWRYLPILVLTNYSDPETISQVFRAGADDFISKPIVGPELVARLFNRLQRSRLWRSLAEVDTLTGVANRYKSSQDINRLIRLANRHDQTMCFAILDLDHFKQINDTYGHGIGDWVLHQFGKLLQNTFRKEDIVGRWGGEEFAVAMYSTCKEDAIKRIQNVLEQWRLEVLVPEKPSFFSVTFSAGVAEYPEDGRDLQLLYQAADAALYQAKETGRNQVLG